MEGVALRLLFAILLVAVPAALQAQAFARKERIEYHDDAGNWVLGQKARESTDGVIVTETVHDTRAQPSVLKAFGRTVQTISYSADGTVLSLADGNGNVTRYGSWKRGVPRVVTKPDGATVAAEVDDSGWIRSVTDENGFATNYAYDPMGRLARTDYPTGDATAWLPKLETFTQSTSSEAGLEAGHWVGTETTGNFRKVTYFDALWRPVTVVEEDASNPSATRVYQRFSYDAGGRVTFTSFNSASSTESSGTWTEYDALGRLTSTTHDSELGPLTELTEYLSGNRLRTTRPKGSATVTTYMAFDRPDYSLPVHVEQPENSITDIQRDTLGSILSITRRDKAGTTQLTRRYIYDAARQLCRTIEPETGSSVIAYDAGGNVVWSASGLTDASSEGCGYAAALESQRVQRTYDTLNQLRTLTFPDGLGNQVLTYTPDGLVKEVRTRNDVSAAEVVNAYGYNRRRLPSTESLSVRGTTLSLGYTYAADGSLANHVYPSGRVVDYQPNARGQATRSGQLATAASYHPDGAIARFTYGNGVQHVSAQNGRRDVSRISDNGPGSALDLSYAYDRNGNVASINDAATGGNASQVMSYDGLDRLLTADSPQFGGDQRSAFSYDVLDNLRSLKVGTTRSYVYGYSGRNQLQTVSLVSNGAAVVGLAFDGRGNLALKNGVQHQFDIGNRLRAVGGLESYAYDGFGRRVEAISADLGTITSFYDREGVLRFQNDARAAKKSEYIYLANRLVARAEVSTLPPPQAAPTLTLPASSITGAYSASWTPVSGADSYRLEQRINSGAWAVALTAAATSWSTSGQASATYSYRVSACNAGGCGPVSAIKQIAVLVPPAAPVLQAPSSSTTGSYTVTWTAPATAQTYRLEEQASAGGAWVEVFNGTQRSWMTSGRGNGSFRYRAQACNGSGCGALSATAVVTVLLPSTHVPTLSGPAMSATGSYAISWNAGTGVSRYEVQERTNGGAWTSLPDTTSSSVAITGKGNGTYGYRVRACNTSGCAAFSAERAVTVLHVPAAPQAAVPTQSGNGAYTVSWSVVATATSYRLEEQLSGSGWVLHYQGSETARAIIGRPNGAHAYRVQACNSSGCGQYSASVTITVRLPPADAPGISSPASSTTGLYTVSWNSVATAESYQLEEQVNGGGWVAQYDGTMLTRYMSQRPSATYQYRVRACNASGCGPYSGVTQTVVAINRIPLDFKVRYSASGYPQQTTRYYFFWNPVVGATRYEINTIKQQTITVQSTVQNPYETAMGGPPIHFGDSYRIRSCDAGSCSDWSEWVKHASY